MAESKEVTFKEYRYKQLERDITRSQQKRKNETVRNVLPTKSKFSVIKAEISSSGLNTVAHDNLNYRGINSCNNNSEKLTPDNRKYTTEGNPIENMNSMPLSQVKSNNVQDTSDSTSKCDNNVLSSTYGINNNDDNVRVFYGWTVMLNKEYQLVIKGTLQCGKAARSKPVHKRLSPFSVMSIFHHKYTLRENLVDEGDELPDYVRRKFYNGFPDDWKNVYHLWQKFVMEGCRKSFCWPIFPVHSDDDLGSEITDVTIIDTFSANPKCKTMSVIEIDHDDENNTYTIGDSTHCSPLKMCKVTNSSTQTPNLQHKSPSNDISEAHDVEVVTQKEIMENVYTQTEKFVCTVSNMVQMQWPEECINKVVQIIECLNFVMSYKTLAQGKSKKEQTSITATNISVQTQKFKEPTVARATQTISDALDVVTICGTSSQRKYNQQYDKSTNTLNVSDYNENSDYKPEESIHYKDKFRRKSITSNVLSNDLPKTTTAKPSKQKENTKSIINNIEYSPLENDNTKHLQLKKQLHANINVKCQSYTDACTKIVSPAIDNISFDNSHQSDDANDKANSNVTFESHLASPQKKKSKPSVRSSENININMKILPKYGSIFMQENSNSSLSDSEKESDHIETFHTKELFADSESCNIDFNDGDNTKSHVSDNEKNISSESSMEQAQLLDGSDTCGQHTFGSKVNPKLLKSWIPNVLLCQSNKSQFGLVFKGTLLNGTGRIAKENFITNFVLRRLSVKLFETVDNEYYQLVGRLRDFNGVPKHMWKDCRNGCPADIDNFCRMWKSIKTGIVDNSPKEKQTPFESDLNVQFSSRGRRVLPPLRYWSGERATVKNDKLAYDSGNCDRSIIFTEGQPSAKTTNDHNGENQTPNPQTYHNQQKPRTAKGTGRLDKSKRNQSLKENEQTGKKELRKQNKSNDSKAEQVEHVTYKEKMLRKRIAQQLHFGSSESDADEMTDDTQESNLKRNRGQYSSKLRKRQKFSTTHLPRDKSEDKDSTNNTRCTYVLKSIPSPDAFSSFEMSMVK